MDQALDKLCYSKTANNQQGFDTVGNPKHKRDLGWGCVGFHPIL